MNTQTYTNQLRAALSPDERRVFAKLKNPQRIQDFLDSLSINFEQKGEIIIHSPRSVLKRKKAQCIEGALLAATALAYWGKPPLLLDLQTPDYDEDHVVALFKENNLWGAMSKTNYPVLRYRDPIYKTVRELAMSYVHEYAVWWGGRHHRKKTLRAYSKPFDLRRYRPERWVTAQTDLDWLADDLDSSPHLPVAPANILNKLRKASKLETQAMRLTEWEEEGA